MRAIPKVGAALFVLTACLATSVVPARAQAPRTDATIAGPSRTYRFDIPEGALTAVLARFEALTHLKIAESSPWLMRGITSPGVSGIYSVEQALEQLLVGTGLAFRFTAADAVLLEVRVEPQQVQVTGRNPPYAVDSSATATKTDTPLRDIPQTVNIVPKELLRDQNAQSLADALKNVPGVSIAQGEGNRDQVVLRGTNTQSDFFVNGIRDDQERFRDLYNVQSIEVLQGPAAVLFGRGGAGGVINVVTTRPVRGAASDAAVELGSFGHKRATTQLGITIGTNASLRVAAMGENSGGFRDHYFLRRYGVNPTVGVDFGTATTLTFGFEHLSDSRRADRGVPSRSGGPVETPRAQLFGSSNQNEATSGVNSGYATIEHRFSPGFTLRNQVLVGRYDKFYQNVYPGSAVSAAGTFSLSAYNHGIDRTNIFNQTDLMYVARSGGVSHTLLMGAEVGHQFQDEVRHTASTIVNVPLSNSVRDADFAAAPIAIDRNAASNILAGYAQDQITLTSQWKALVGARLDRFAVSVNDHVPGNSDLSRVDGAFSPRVGLIYQPNAVASLYTSYSYTFLPSGQTLGLATNTVQLAPENAKNYEVGAKLDLLEKRVNVAAAVFRLDRNNVKNVAPDDPTRLVLTGQQRTDGITVSTAGSLTSKSRIYGGYAHLDARITRTTASAPVGRKVGLVPQDQLTLWTTYDLSDHWGGGGGVIKQTQVYTSFSNQVTLPGFTRFDALLYYRLRGYRIAVNVENLFNASYYPTANGDNNISPGAPRTVQLSLRTIF